MSVIVTKRNLSDLEFYHNALVLEKELTLFFLKDFGIKDKVRELKYFCDIKKLSADDKDMFLKIVEKYNMDERVIEAYPIWLIEHYRKSMLRDLNDLFRNITEANSIFPTTMAEWEERRMYQTEVIADSQNLLMTMNRIVNTLPVNSDKCMRYVDMIDRETALLRGWRKSGNKMLKQLKDVKNVPGHH